MSFKRVLMLVSKPFVLNAPKFTGASSIRCLERFVLRLISQGKLTMKKIAFISVLCACLLNFASCANKNAPKADDPAQPASSEQKADEPKPAAAGDKAASDADKKDANADAPAADDAKADANKDVKDDGAKPAASDADKDKKDDKGGASEDAAKPAAADAGK
jgi:hypothetical protein